MENNNDISSEDNFLFGQDKNLPFSLPNGYFESFSAKVMNKIEHEEELAAYNQLASVNRELKFIVPQNYFTSLANIIEYKYEHVTYTQLSALEKPLTKGLPENYFEKLNQKVISGIESSSELADFPALAGIEKKNAFAVTPHYFEDTISEVKEKIHAKGSAFPDFIEQLYQLLFKPKMAFAFASVVVVIGVSSVIYFSNRENPRNVGVSGDCHTVACLEKNEILNEKHADDFDDENLYDMVDVDELDKEITKQNSNPDL